jgi:hypothetical protein
MAELTRGQLLKDPEVLGTTTSAAKIRLWDGDESNYVDIAAPTTIGTNFTLTLPANDGDANQYLQTDGNGILTWATVSASPGGSTTQIQYNNAGSFAGAAGLTTDGTHLTINSAGELRFADTTGGEYVAFKAPGTVTANRTYTLPDTIGTAGQVLKIDTRTDTTAILIWSDDQTGGAGSSPGGSDTYVQFNDAGLFGGDADFTYNKTTNALTVTGTVTAGGFNATTGTDYKINSTSVLTATTLGSGVTSSSLTSVGTLTALQVDNINIDLNTISSTNTNGNIVISPNGTGIIQAGNLLEIRSASGLRLQDSANASALTINVPTTITSPYTLTLPAAIGSVDEVLAFSATGVASFVSNFRAINFVIDGGGSVISTGIAGYLQVPFDCQILEWTLLADTTGSIVVDIWKDTYANYPPIDADSITAATTPTITTADKNTSSTLTGWTTTITSGDVLAFNVDSVTTLTKVTIVLKLKMT